MKSALLSLLMLCSAVAWGNPDSYRKLDVTEYAQEDPDLLALPEELLPHLEKLKKIRGKEPRLEALHHLLFDKDGFDIRYDARQTFTAAQTFHYRRGNCLALSSLVVAAARYLGITAYYQTVRIPVIWEQRESFYVVPGHVNVGIDIYNRKHNVEFLAIFSDEDDINPKKRISDKRALAEYHNNIGMEYLDSGYAKIGEWHMRKAAEIAPDLDFVWSNLGVLSKRRGDYDRATQYYRRALSLNRSNYSALNNLYILYKEQGDKKRADKIGKRVQRYMLHNPHHLGRLAETDIRTGHYDEAIKKLRRAIRIDERIPSLHHLLGLSYYHKHDYRRSQAALEQAQRVASLEDWDRYAKKLEVLARHIDKPADDR